MKDGRQPQPENKEGIEAAAAAWLARSGEGMDAAAEAEFGRWCAADPRHAAAVARLSQAVALLEKLPQLRGDPRLLRRARPAPLESAPPAGRSLRRFFRPLAGVAAGLALAAAGWWLWPGRTVDGQSYATEARGYQRIVLTDGSVVELNASSTVEVRFTATTRRVLLTGGEAHFSVTKNPARPFIVTARQVEVRAIGTMFDVRHAAHGIEVLVTEGRVAVADAEAPPAGAAKPAPPDTPLAAGQRLLIAAGGATAAAKVEPVSLEEMRALLAWQDPLLVFADTPLAEAVARFNRHNAVQLVVGDASLGARPVGGSFKAGNVEAFVRLLEATEEITVERIGAGRIVLRRALAAPRR